MQVQICIKEISVPYLDKYVTKSAFTDTWITNRVHNSNSPSIERHEVHIIQCPCSCHQPETHKMRIINTYKSLLESKYSFLAAHKYKQIVKT